MQVFPKNTKGMAYVSDKESFENFILDLYTLEDSVFDTAEDWYKFFCDSNYIDYVDGFEPDILQLVADVSDDKQPESYPAFILFDFEDFFPSYMLATEAIFEIIPIEALDIKSITTRENMYSVHFMD